MPCVLLFSKDSLVNVKDAVWWKTLVILQMHKDFIL